MTQHEMLAIVDIAEEWHAKPISEGGHNEPLTMHCFEKFLADHAIHLGFPPSYLAIQFRSRFSRLVSTGWIEVYAGTCGNEHFILTEKGIAQLDLWNEKGCQLHQRKGRNRCAAPNLPRRSREAA